jgi:hypothetical protein
MEKPTRKLLLPAPSGSAASVITLLQASPLASTDGEMIRVDIKSVDLARWQHSENAMVKDASVDDMSVSNHSFPFPTASEYFVIILGTRLTRSFNYFGPKSPWRL